MVRRDNITGSLQCQANLPAVRRQLADHVDEIHRLEDTCKAMLRLLHQLEQLTNNTARFNQKLIEVDQLRLRIRQLNRAFEFVDSAAQLAEMGTSMPGYLRVSLFRPIGIGMLIGGALTGIALALPLVVSAIRSMQTAAKMKTEASQDEMPIKLLYGAVVGAFIVLLITAILSTPEITVMRAAVMALLAR